MDKVSNIFESLASQILFDIAVATALAAVIILALATTCVVGYKRCKK